MAQEIIDNYNQYRQRIQLLRSTGDVLLQRINILETEMNKRKQQDQYPFVRDINALDAMVKKLLTLLAEIKASECFQMRFERFDIYSRDYIKMCNVYFENLTRQLINRLKMKRFNRLRQLEYYSFKEITSEIFNPVHFQIEQ